MIQQLYRESWLDYMQTISQQRSAAAQTQLRDFDDVDKQNQIESGFEKVLQYIFHIIKYNSILLTSCGDNCSKNTNYRSSTYIDNHNDKERNMFCLSVSKEEK